MNLNVTQKLRKRLLIYPVLFIVAVLVTWFLVELANFTPTRGYYKWAKVQSCISHGAPLEMESLLALQPQLFDDLSDGDWIIDNLPSQLRADLNFVASYDGSFIDGWGNPIHLVIHHDTAPPSIEFYSTGEDGVSSSQGNDPDDINSWGQDGSTYYPDRLRRTHQWHSIKQATVHFLILFPPLILLYEYVRRHIRYPASLCQQCGYDLRGSQSACPECGNELASPPT